MQQHSTSAPACSPHFMRRCIRRVEFPGGSRRAGRETLRHLPNQHR
jgi:hypothetical protein